MKTCKYNMRYAYAFIVHPELNLDTKMLAGNNISDIAYTQSKQDYVGEGYYMY